MIWIRLYDPARRPAHWTEIVRDTQFVVFVCDAGNGAPRDAEGHPFVADASSDGNCAALCDDAAEARNFARGIVARRPELCCEIYDAAGKSGPPLEVVYDPSVRDKYTGPAHARRLAFWGAALACIGIVLVVIDARRDFAWIWGYVLGLKALLIGGVLLTRGIVEWRECRRFPDSVQNPEVRNDVVGGTA